MQVVAPRLGTSTNRLQKAEPKSTLRSDFTPPLRVPLGWRCPPVKSPLAPPSPAARLALGTVSASSDDPCQWVQRRRFRPERFAGPEEAGAALGPMIAATVAEHGALLLQGLPLGDASRSNAFFRAAGDTLFEYDGFIVKLPRAGGAKPVVANGQRLTLHTECSFLADPPGKIAFHCIRPADQGGASLIGRNTDFTKRLPSSILSEFAQRGGVTYHRVFPHPDGLAQIDPRYAFLNTDWMAMTGATTPDQAEAYFTQRHFETYWDDQGGLNCHRTTDATVPCPKTGAPLWLNFAQSPDYDPLFKVTYADGTRISSDVRSSIVAALDATAEPLHMAHGDLLILDNTAVMHGREAFQGERTILQIMTH